MNKTFKIGEYAIGGLINVQNKGKLIRIEAQDWEDKTPILTGYYSKEDKNGLMNFLNELTSYYHAEKIFNYIHKK